MAATFKGWGDAWGGAWGGAPDPNAMRGAASFGLVATGTLTALGAAPQQQDAQAGGHRPIRARTRVLPPQWFDDAAAVLEEELALQMLGMV